MATWAGWITNGLGIGAALCSMSSFAPQVIKLYREREASSVSLRMCLLTVTGFALWIGYGLALESWPLVGSNAVCLILSGSILALKLRFNRRRRRPS
jgi:MtN3 and saliva related transmembrane protein